MTHLPGGRRRAVLPTATLATALLLTACGGGSSEATDTSEAAAEESTVGTAFGDVTVPADPERVVTLAESALDVSLAVGVTPVGTTASRGGDTAPAYLGEDAADIPIVATVSEPNLEAILEAQPDVILASAGLAQDQYDALTAIAPTVVPDTATGGDWQEPLHTYAEALGADDELTAALDDVTSRAEAIAEEGSLDGTATVLRWMANGPVLMNAALMPGSLLQSAGAGPVEAAQLGDRPHSDPLSLENLAQVDADRLFLAAFGADGTGALEAARSQPAFTQLEAVQEGATTEVNGSVWSSASGPIAADLVMDDIEAAVS
ncbi:iron complex transport system substrate-binding protein [Geodermatophilus amargosae]|uniref:Iron complex transport system substrate-binding protein n=1 Tax=Geodermatophilus amargosae TaxID=1296565 RepID=A0A1I7CJB5_9ACTN|nr:iron-siderophore ABC transporter substrate-binding protein [Geodermatophilus amargosae]SFT99530.1 iron complex transport system substrate-binding protein [Geodermatophilus amargosae]